MKTLTRREKLIKAILDLPDNQIDSVWNLIQKEIETTSYDITDNLLEGIHQLGMVLRGEMEAISARDLLNEL